MQSFILRISTILLHLLGDADYRQSAKASQNFARIKLLLYDKVIRDQWKPMYFLFLDETVNSYTKVSCFTGLYLPEKKYHKIRRDIYKIHRKIKDKLGLGQYHDAVELHGKELLKGYTLVDDNFRYQILSDCVDIVNRYKIQVIRLGYNNAAEIAKFLKGENEKLYGLHMLNYCGILNQLTRKHKVFVLMDSTDQKVVNTLSRMVYLQTSNTLTFPDRSMSYAIDKPQNIVESVSYVDSRYSEVMQMTDLISYLFNKMDYEAQGRVSRLNEFAKRLCEIGCAIDKKLVINSIIRMNNSKS